MPVNLPFSHCKELVCVLRPMSNQLGFYEVERTESFCALVSRRMKTKYMQIGVHGNSVLPYYKKDN